MIILLPTKYETDLAYLSNLKYKENIFIMQSGLGKRTLKTLIDLNIKQKEKIILSGFCGALDDQIKIGTICNIKECSNKMNKIYLKKTNTNIQYYTLLSTNKAVYTINRRNNLKQFAELVDMEAFYLAEYCLNNNIELEITKIVFDTCDKKIDINIFKNEIKEKNKKLNYVEEIFVNFLNTLS